MRRARGILALLVVLVAACGRTPPPPKEYQLSGQILAIKADGQHGPEVVVKHGDIKGFMPAMTMPYQVRDKALLADKQPGDLVTATLVVGETEAHLSALTKTGHAPLDTPPPALDKPDILEAGQPVPDALLVNQDGKPVPFSSLRGHRVALTFMYTRCPLPDFCPLMNRNFAAVQDAVQKTPALDDVRLITITLDPQYDTPTVLKEQARLYKANPAIWSFVTGEPKEVARFSAAFGIYVEPDKETKDQIIHNLRTAVIDPEGKVVKVQSGNSWTPAELVADLKTAPAPGH